MAILHVFELLGVAIDLLDLAGFLVEAVAWLQSRGNRRERRNARRRGEMPPRRTGWSWTFLVLGIALLAGNGLLVAYLLARS